MGAAARLVDEIAHRHAGGRWLATGGGGYDAYRVVPRTWALVWLAGAHRPRPGRDARGLAGALGRRRRRRSARRACRSGSTTSREVGREHDRHAQIADAASRRTIEHVVAGLQRSG